MFFQTVVVNSPFRDRLRQSGSGSLSAPDVSDCLLGVHFIDWLRGQPKTLGMDDFERLIASPALFARKFDETQDSIMLDLIDAHLDTRTSSSIASWPMVAPGADVQPAPANGLSGMALASPRRERTEAKVQQSGRLRAASPMLEQRAIEVVNERDAWNTQANGHEAAIAVRKCPRAQGEGRKKKRKRKAAQRQR
jgi:hypothetical protein